MTQPPRRNLPPDSEQWGRWMEQAVVDITAEQSALAQGIGNSLTAINGSLNLIAQQIAQLQAQPESLGAYFTHIGPLSSQPVATVGATVTVNKPSWATKASVIITNDMRFGGDPVAFFARSYIAVVPVYPAGIGSESIFADAEVQVNGDTVRQASSAMVYNYGPANMRADATGVRLQVYTQRDALPSGKSLAYRASGLVFWTA